MLYKILAVAIVVIFLNSLIKNLKSEFCLLINICGGLIIFYLLIDGLTELLEGVNFLGGESNITTSIIAPIFKVIGVGYITEFCSDIAEESGNKMIANKVIFGGKVAICVMAFPIVKNLFYSIISLI